MIFKMDTHDKLFRELGRYEEILAVEKKVAAKKAEIKKAVEKLMAAAKETKLAVGKYSVSQVYSTRYKIKNIDEVPEECIVPTVTTASVKAWQDKIKIMKHPPGCELLESKSLRITVGKDE